MSPSEIEIEPGPRDWDGNLIKEGNTVYFNSADKGTVLGEEEDGRIRIESWDKNADPNRPWKIIWLIPPGLLKKQEPKSKPKAEPIKPTSRGSCNR
jgi:hypothetical protein